MHEAKQYAYGYVIQFLLQQQLRARVGAVTVGLKSCRNRVSNAQFIQCIV